MKFTLMFLFLHAATAQLRDSWTDRWTDRSSLHGADGILSRVCTRLVQQLGWKRVVVLFDNTGEQVVQDMWMYWERTRFQIPAQVTNVQNELDSDHSIRVYFAHLYHSVLHLNILLVAELNTASAIIRQVNDFDLHSNRSTDYRHRSKWIIVSEESVKENITTFAKHLENVALIPFLNVNGIPMKNVKLFTLENTNPGPSLTPVALHERPVTADTVFPNIKYKYNGKQLVVVRAAYDDSFTFPVLTNGTVTYEGYAIDVLDAIAQHLNFTYIIVHPEDKKWGSLVNGTWNGLVGVLARREADLQISSLTIHEDRVSAMYFLQPPILAQFIDVLYKQDSLYEDTWLTYIRPFSPGVFLCIAASAGGLCLLFVTFESLRSAEQSSQSLTACASYRTMLVLFSRIGFFAVASAAQQGTAIKTRTTPGNILVASWRLFLIAMTAAYTANLVAGLTSRKARVPFKTLGELVDNEDFTFGMGSTTVNRLIFEKTKSGYIRRAWTTLQRRAKFDPRVISDGDEYHLQRALSGKYGWIVSRKTGNLKRKANCSLVFMNSPFSSQYLAFGVPIGSPYINNFEKTLSILNDNGVFINRRKKWFKEPCASRKQTSLQSVRAIEISDVRGVFILSAAGIGLAIVFLILEIVCISARIK